MLESVELFINVSWYLYVYMFLLVISLYGEYRIQFSFPVDYDFVSLWECLDDILCMLLSNILYYKFIND